MDELLDHADAHSLITLGSLPSLHGGVAGCAAKGCAHGRQASGAVPGVDCEPVHGGTHTQDNNLSAQERLRYREQHSVCRTRAHPDAASGAPLRCDAWKLSG